MAGYRTWKDRVAVALGTAAMLTTKKGSAGAAVKRFENVARCVGNFRRAVFLGGR